MSEEISNYYFRTPEMWKVIVKREKQNAKSKSEMA
jgi:uncharacterized protein (DUF2249 family)